MLVIWLHLWRKLLDMLLPLAYMFPLWLICVKSRSFMWFMVCRCTNVSQAYFSSFCNSLIQKFCRIHILNTTLCLGKKTLLLQLPVNSISVDRQSLCLYVAAMSSYSELRRIHILNDAFLGEKALLL